MSLKRVNWQQQGDIIVTGDGQMLIADFRKSDFCSEINKDHVEIAVHAVNNHKMLVDFVEVTIMTLDALNEIGAPPEMRELLASMRRAAQNALKLALGDIYE